MPECPYCGRWFKTKRGLNQHIAKSHETKFGGVRVLDPTTIDPLGAAERRAERKKKRKKGFGLW
ncbi:MULTISPECIES: C2H2-type zinc finger protein [Archaeoglobus]|uniref:C2H2-type domain-containing protein n=2 Tax=Archaeoglobus fulgidus TaxID=2234 RepID=O29078_ARCFU|nr:MULTISPECIES: C2H2-type zinc finger protein [Archaeoglobus]AAB90067.1 predicted coding region AF_1189 [Archaeoglobus fulgidus DSM 4304]KUJ93246.1 MAG: hypothetical protein XD40_1584 [Archaeoglobus fulgidus]KUK06897.1 MAG: hypothetical protein XD48_0893 [Archaeoglobus fulgidus]MDI3497573.1 hypothetical protein [Archaeoglobus sp.]